MTRGSETARRTGAVRIDNGLIFDAAIGMFGPESQSIGFRKGKENQRQKARILKLGPRLSLSSRLSNTRTTEADCFHAVE